MRTILPIVFVAAMIQLAHGASTINSTKAYSYGANIGWMNWLPSSTDGVVIGEFICSGYIYGANIGWINVGSGSPVNHIQYQNNSGNDYGLNYGIDPQQPGYGILRGYAYGANIGWINFEATGNPRIRFTDGALEGYAYSANCGWIFLGDPSGHYLQTDHIAMGIDSNGNGIADAWEYLYFGNIGVNPNADADGDGMTNLQEYLEGTNPIMPNDRLRIIAYSTNPGGINASLTWSSTVGRLYAIETSLNLLAWGTDTTFFYPIAPDTGTQTTRPLIGSAAAKRFYRVRAVRPLP